MGRRKGLGAGKGSLKRFSTGRVEFVTGRGGERGPGGPETSAKEGEGEREREQGSAGQRELEHARERERERAINW